MGFDIFASCYFDILYCDRIKLTVCMMLLSVAVEREYSFSFIMVLVHSLDVDYLPWKIK